MKYHLYSHNDLDGVGCGIVAKCAFGTGVEIRYLSVSGLNAQVERYLERAGNKGFKDAFLFITDLSVHEQNEKAIEELVRGGGRVRLIDHHKSALSLNRYEWASVKVEEEDGRLASATSLFYDYLVRNGLLAPTQALDEFVELVRLYDTWEWDRLGKLEAKRLNDLFYMISIDEFEEKMVERLGSGSGFTFDEFEEKILDMEDEKIERYVRRKRRETVQLFLNGEYAGVVHAENYHSELGNELGKEYPHLDYIAILNMGGRRMSLRTIHDDVDVSEVAGRYGGGGHAKAAGCSMTEDAYRQFVAGTFPLEPIRPDAFRNIYNLKESPSGCVYESREGELLYLFPLEKEWRVEINGAVREEAFGTFAQAERYVKRHHGAWLAKDDAFVKHLMEFRREAAAPSPVERVL
ncbi:oligoribonuclease [Paenibacillus aurantius]|uniref:Oligoribonuclease n=1 Tax=Paenibacillus aurantius TaxID=2918900 RepID=A0AA96LDF0_9BACL|nr:oligoribonuclease [Paenibacillus aurantius]WNQ10051.1 oligoribonuclease [Paenibacillus aurantius]